MEILSWLEQIEMSHHRDLFREHALDMDVLPDLTEADLKDLGIPLGDRKRLMRAIAAMGEQTAATTSQPAPSTTLQSVPSTTEDIAPEAQRRHLTVMFVDLMDSTRIAGDLDPEEMRDLIRAYQNVVAGEVSRFDGYIAKFMGDGVLCYFGFPTANEDDAERAVHAGRAIAQSVSRLRIGKEELANVRIGIASGIVVVGEIIGEAEARERDVVGETPNIAARLQSVAEPGQIIISDKTHHLVSKTFHTQEVQLPPLKGVSVTLRAYVALEERTLEDKRATRDGDSTTAIIGRNADLGVLERAWQDTVAGAARSVLLVGEPGIGKSRIIQSFVEDTGLGGQAWMTLQASPYHQQTPLYPIVELIKRGAYIKQGDKNSEAIEKLKDLVAEFMVDHPDAGANFANLLGLDFAGHFDALDLAPQQLRARTLQQLTEFFLHRQRDGPLLVIAEDMHWLDQTTLEVLMSCMDAPKTQKTLFLFVGRSDGVPETVRSAVQDVISLGRLDQGAVDEIIRDIAGDKAFPAELSAEIYRKTDGVPLFVRELTKMILETGVVRETADAFVLSGNFADLAIPSTLHDSLMARLDRLKHAKRTAQYAACIGRTFDLEVLAEVTGEERATVTADLAELIAAELVNPPRGASDTYSFQHALVRDAAYGGLLRSQRRHIHVHVALALHRRTAAPEALAYHYERAAKPATAADFLMQAGQAALRICAADDAISHFQHGINLLEIDEAPEGSNLLRMRLYGLLGTGYMFTKSWGAEEVHQAYGKALDLVDETDNPQERIWVIWGAWVYRQVQGDIRASRSEAARAMKLAQGHEDDDVGLIAQIIALQTAFYEGRWRDAMGHGAKIEQLYDPVLHGGLKDVYSLDLLLVWYVHAAQASWMLGHIAQSREFAAKAQAHVAKIEHSHSRAWVAVWGSNLALFSGDLDTLRDAVPPAVKISQTNGFDYVAQLGQLLLCAAEVGDGAAADTMDAALALFQGTGAGITVPYFLTFKAQTLLHAGLAAQARDVCEQALAQIAQGGERWAEPFALRTLGDICAVLEPGQAQDAYQRAVECAQSQGAVMWQLEAEIALYRHINNAESLGKSEESRRSLLTQ